MKTNVQITAVKKEFKNDQNGYEVKAWRESSIAR